MTETAFRRWPSERPLFALVVVAALGIWILLAVSLIGIVYAAMLGVLFFLAHVAFLAHLRGSGVRLGPAQFPELHQRVADLSKAIGLARPPQAYLLQSGGELNALATRFLGTSFIVIYSDLLDACGDNEDARDFIIGHELGHLRAGHLRLRWLLLPGLVVPFLGTAYSRACEHTSDRFGLAASRDLERALDGLCILAAGGRVGPRVNRRALVAQQTDLNTFWMSIGRWLSTHPPIAARVAALQPGLADGVVLSRGPVAVAAGAVIVTMLVPFAAAGVFVATVLPGLTAAFERERDRALARTDPVAARRIVEPQLASLREAADRHRETAGAPPADDEQLYDFWLSLHPGESAPVDPFDGLRFGYSARGDAFVIWSSGPDPNDTADDIAVYSGDPASE